MSSILILIHNSLNLKICKKMVEIFIKENSIDAEIIAPMDFAMSGAKPAEMLDKISMLVPENNDIQIIFLEANLGFPSVEDLQPPTINVLKYLVEQCPGALFILKSHTEGALISAQKLLEEEQVPAAQIIVAGGVISLNNNIQQSMMQQLDDNKESFVCR